MGLLHGIKEEGLIKDHQLRDELGEHGVHHGNHVHGTHLGTLVHLALAAQGTAG